MASAVTQLFFDQMMILPSRFRGLARRIALVVSAGGISIYSRAFGDPIVLQLIHGTQLAMPMSHALPRILLRHPDYSSNIGRIAAALHQKYSNLTMLDIGANIGDTVVMVRRYCTIPMLCVDGNPIFFDLLQRNSQQWSSVYLERAFVSAESGLVSGRICSQGGSGHLSNDAGYQTEARSLTDILNSHPRFESAKLLKIDTDGFDTLIVKGAVDFLRIAHAVVYLEYDPNFFLGPDPDGFSVFEFLRNNGYVSALFFRNTGEFFVDVNLHDEETLLKLHSSCTGQKDKRYFDVCVFHEEDADLCTGIVAAESSLQHRH